MIKIQEKDILKVFRKEKAMTIKRLTSLLKCSQRTVERRLAKWHTYTSYNYNGKYYILPTIPKFDKSGLWSYKEIYFSKTGNLKQTVLALINNSPAGLTVNEATNLLKVSLGSFLSQNRNIQKLQREKIANRFVYFSSDRKTFHQQKNKRQQDALNRKLTQLPADTEAVIILVEKIKHSNLSIEQLAMRLNKQGHKIEKETINKLFEYHALQKKTPNSK